MKFKKPSLLALLGLTTLLFASNSSQPNPGSGANAKLYDFSFVNTDFAAVFQALGITAGLDILSAPDITGKVTLRVTRKTWQEALDILCNLYDLTWVIEDKYISVHRTATYQAKQRQQAERKEEADQVAPLVRKNFAIRHAKAESMQAVLETMRSPRGKITVVERNNAVIVFDTEQRIKQMEKTLAELDVETLQIVITAKLVVVDSRLARELGVDWTAKMGRGAVTATSAMAPTPAGSLNDSRNQVVIASTPADASSTTNIMMGVLDNNVGVRINSILGDASTEILASPQISTLDHTEAKIFMGEKVSIRVVDAQGVAATRLIEAGIKLTVTPHVTGDNRILLDLKPENNTHGFDEKGQPVIRTQEAETKVVVADGETVVIGGLTTNEESEQEAGIPFLKDIPFFGNLFKHSKRSIVKRDLVIFVTPRIMRDNITHPHEKALTSAVSPNAPEVTAPVQSPAVTPEQSTPEPIGGDEQW